MTPHVDNERPLVLVLMGVSGSGKSTIAGVLAGKLGWDLEEGDDLHPQSNVDKMHAGHPLTDEDRWPWLEKVGAWIKEHVDTKTPGIITCSALRKKYRDLLRGPHVVFVHLDGGRDLVDDRLSKRHGHFMPESLLGSQFNTLEELDDDENGIIVEIGGTPREIAKDIIARLDLEAEPHTATLRVTR